MADLASTMEMADAQLSTVDLARRASEPLDPGEGLSAIATLRGRLGDLEQACVETAIGEGWSWSRIARHLGVSRQAVHRKYAGFQSVVNGRRNGRRSIALSEATRQAIQRAMAEAQSVGHLQVDAGHLLLGVACSDREWAHQVLREAGISVARTRDQVSRLHGGSARATGMSLLDAGPSPPSDEARPLPLAPSARAVLREAVREAASLGSEELEPAHLLLALLRAPKGPGRPLMIRMGADPDDIRAKLRALLERTS